MPSLRRRSTASTISTAVRPNLERSPVDSIHLPAPLVRQPGAHADVGPDAELLRDLDDQLDLAKAVDDDDRAAAETLGEQGGLDVGAVLVAVADDQGARRIEQGEGDQQLGLAAGLEPNVLRGTVLDDLFDDVAAAG